MKTATEITPKMLLIAIVALLLLTAASWALSYLHLPGPLGIALGLGIAAVKVCLVWLFFMELAEHRGGVRLVALTAPVFVGLMVLLVLTDVWTR